VPCKSNLLLCCEAPVSGGVSIGRPSSASTLSPLVTRTLCSVLFLNSDRSRHRTLAAAVAMLHMCASRGGSRSRSCKSCTYSVRDGFIRYIRAWTLVTRDSSNEHPTTRPVSNFPVRLYTRDRLARSESQKQTEYLSSRGLDIEPQRYRTSDPRADRVGRRCIPRHPIPARGSAGISSGLTPRRSQTQSAGA
jgi:hypothetical protein